MTDRSDEPPDRRGNPKRKRKPHPKKDYEDLLKEFEAEGWTFWRGKGYFLGRCSCPGKHSASIVLTPSSQRTLLRTRKQLEVCRRRPRQ